MRHIVIFLVLLSCISNSLCLRLLLVFPTPLRSHYILGSELGKGLAKAGHEVTIISAFEEKKPVKNFRNILVSEFFETKVNKDNTTDGFDIYGTENIPVVVQLFFFNFLGQMTDAFLEHPKTQELLNSNERFDAVIAEQFYNDAIKIFAHHFNAHLIVFSPMGVNRWVNHFVANPEPPSYIPDIFLGYTGDMNLFQRICNLLFGVISDLNLYFLVYPQQNAIVKKHFPNAPHLNTALFNVSLILLNSHESVNHPVPHVPNMIDIGGFHVNPPKELRKDIKEFMDNATDGVIYFSMGSNLVPSQMPKEKKEAILKVLGARKEQVLWKWDEDTLENKPDNMMISKWFPQQAILAHPNCKLFITHGGLLSTTETIYLGVPVLAIPIFGDQKLNAARIADLGYGKSIHLSEINENNFATLLSELLENPSYRENAQARSRIMHDRPVKPMDSAVFWVEYVIRHNGAPHLRVAGLDIPFYKYYMLDVFAVVSGGLILLVYVLLKTCGCIWGWIKSRSIQKKLKSKSKKKRE